MYVSTTEKEYKKQITNNNIQITPYINGFCLDERKCIAWLFDSV